MWTETNPVDWFEIPMSDLKRAQEFYEHIFNVKLTITEIGNLKMAWFPMKQDAAGATGTLIMADSYKPSYEGSMVYFSVVDVEAVLKRVEEKGGKIVSPRMSIGEHGFVGHFEDSEGNRVALHSVR
jgi:predicted enzyme related to lactoylglutathione lyase